MKVIDKLRALKPSTKTRGYLYRVGTAAGVILVAKGAISEGDFQMYEALAVALLGLASANTPVRGEVD